MMFSTNMSEIKLIYTVDRIIKKLLLFVYLFNYFYLFHTKHEKVFAFCTTVLNLPGVSQKPFEKILKTVSVRDDTAKFFKVNLYHFIRKSDSKIHKNMETY